MSCAHTLRARNVAPALKSAIAQGLLGTRHGKATLFDCGPPAAQFFDLGAFRKKIQSLRDAFPDGKNKCTKPLSANGVLHTLAVKANPFSTILGEAHQMGLGAESASIVEVWQALRQGIPAQNIIYDSPAKAAAEIRHALSIGLLLNLDNMSELRKTREALESLRNENIIKSQPRIGLRINPQMGPGTIAATSTATKTSKFGFATREGDVDPIELYLQNRWLNAIHVHTGSQGCPLELSAQGVAEALRMAIEVNKRAGTQQIQHFDMGGGVPADYDSDADSREFQEYRDLIDTHASGLWEQGFRVYTEMGRSLTAKMGWTATRVEAVKESGGRRIAIGHVGADLFVRTAYQPQNWPHRISVFTHDGEPKDVAEEELLPQDVAVVRCWETNRRGGGGGE